MYLFRGSLCFLSIFSSFSLALARSFTLSLWSALPHKQLDYKLSSLSQFIYGLISMQNLNTHTQTHVWRVKDSRSTMALSAAHILTAQSKWFNIWFQKIVPPTPLMMLLLLLLSLFAHFVLHFLYLVLVFFTFSCNKYILWWWEESIFRHHDLFN